MKKVLLFAALFTGAISHAQECTAVATLNENFNTFNTEESGFPQNCWSSLSDGPMVYIDGEEENNYVTFYASNFADTDAFLITPELTSLSGNYELSFDTQRIVMGPPPAPGTVTIQLGTLTDNTDAETFVAFGEPITVTDEYITHSNIAITAAEGSYIAFKITGDIVHNAAFIDNVVWSEIPPAVCDAVETLNENFNEFAADNLPQNCWSSLSDGPMVYIDGEEEDNYVTFYASNFADTDAFLITPELTSLSGNYELSFDTQRIVMGPPPAPGTVTIQLGTLTDNTDADTFIAFGEPITVTDEYITHSNIAITATEGSYIAFKITGDIVHNAALIDNVIWSEIPSNVCDAVDTLDENFNEFAAEDFPQNCWLSLANGPMVYVDQDEEGTDKYATYYSFFTVNEPGYIITPEITASTSGRTLTFDSYKIGAGSVTMQIGTISDAEDEETFTAIGDLIELTQASEEYIIEIPALADNSRLAFQITADTNHHAAILDNITLANSLSNIDFNKVDFTIYPNPSSDKNITVELNADSENTNLVIYNITGAKVFESVLTSNTQQLNLNSLNSGMYIVKVQAGNYTETKKLIIR